MYGSTYTLYVHMHLRVYVRVVVGVCGCSGVGGKGGAASPRTRFPTCAGVFKVPVCEVCRKFPCAARWSNHAFCMSPAPVFSPGMLLFMYSKVRCKFISQQVQVRRLRGSCKFRVAGGLSDFGARVPQRNKQGSLFQNYQSQYQNCGYMFNRT